MKRALGTTLFLCALGALGGCPIYNHEDGGCYRDRDCAPGYFCDDRTGDCISDSPSSGSCTRPEQCGTNQTCTRAGVCAAGDCTFNGCVSGYACDSSSGTWKCVASSGNPVGSGGEAGSTPRDPEAGAGGTGGSVAPVGEAGMSASEAGSGGQAGN